MSLKNMASQLEREVNKCTGQLKTHQHLEFMAKGKGLNWNGGRGSSEKGKAEGYTCTSSLLPEVCAEHSFLRTVSETRRCYQGHNFQPHGTTWGKPSPQNTQVCSKVGSHTDFYFLPFFSQMILKTRPGETSSIPDV